MAPYAQMTKTVRVKVNGRIIAVKFTRAANFDKSIAFWRDFSGLIAVNAKLLSGNTRFTDVARFSLEFVPNQTTVMELVPLVPCRVEKVNQVIPSPVNGASSSDRCIAEWLAVMFMNEVWPKLDMNQEELI